MFSITWLTHNNLSNTHCQGTLYKVHMTNPTLDLKPTLCIIVIQFTSIQMHASGAHLYWMGIVYFSLYHPVTYNENFTNFDTCKLLDVWLYYYYYYCIRYHSGLYTMQGPSYLGKTTLVSIWFIMILTHANMTFKKILSP